MTSLYENQLHIYGLTNKHSIYKKRRGMSTINILLINN